MRHSKRVNHAFVSLTNAEARQVLGEYDHRLEFPAGDDFVIIYGPNGVGKTKFLEIIHAMTRVDGRALSTMPFYDATLEFSAGTILSVGPTRGEVGGGADKRRLRRELRFTLSRAGGQLDSWVYSGNSFEDWLLEK
uniref:hypothetical protein n=1 Tax=Enterococcus faecium TaxID=1352 RepID=UPI0030C8B226